MLGDELKKALEPIQASDELLEKTRRAIEQARIQQAQETLDKAVRKDARRTLFLKAMVPVACVLLIFGGLAVVLLPKLAGSKKDEGRSGVRREHNDAVDTVTAEIDSILGEKSHSKNFSYRATENRDYSEETTEAWESQIEMETTVSSEESEGRDDVAENTTPAPTVHDHSGDADDMFFYFSDSTSIRADGHSVHISGDKTGIVIDYDSRHTMAPTIKKGNDHLGQESMEEVDKVTGLFYDEDTKTLYITISHFEDSQYVPSKKYLYAVHFENGKLSEDGPELVYEFDF